MRGRISRRRFIELGIGALGATVLAACQPTPTPTAQPQPTKAAATNAPAATAVPTKAPTATAVPTQAPVPKVTWWQNGVALTRPEGSSPAKLEAVRKYILDHSGVDVTPLIPPAGAAAAEKLNLLVGSASETLDAFQGAWATYKNACVPINDLMAQYGSALKTVINKAAWDGVTDNEGKMWGIPRLGTQCHTNPVWVNTGWLKEANLPMPTTLGDLEKAFLAFRQKHPDCIILTSNLKDFRNCTQGGFTEYGNSRWLDPADNKIKPVELAPGHKDWLEKVAGWYRDGWLFKESLATHDDLEVFKTGKVAIFAGWYSRVTLLVEKARVEGRPELQYDFVPGLKGPKGFLKTANVDNSSAQMITKKAKNPDAFVKFANWIASDIENYITCRVGIKGVDWEWVDKDKRLIKPLITDIKAAEYYAGEYGFGYAASAGYMIADPLTGRHYEYMLKNMYDCNDAKMPFDATIAYDNAAMAKKAPNMGDVDRMINEEITKFITGVRPLAEWDSFLKQLNAAGLPAYVDAYSEQYNAKKR